MASYSWWKLLDIFFIASLARFVFGLSQQVMTYAQNWPNRASGQSSFNL